MGTVSAGPCQRQETSYQWGMQESGGLPRALERLGDGEASKSALTLETSLASPLFGRIGHPTKSYDSMRRSNPPKSDNPRSLFLGRALHSSFRNGRKGNRGKGKYIGRNLGALPFFNRLLLLLPASPSSLSVDESFFAESKLSQLSCRFNAAGPRLDGRYSGVFLAEESGVANAFVGVGALESVSAAERRFTLVNPELTAVKPPELMAVNPDVCGAARGDASVIGTSRSESLLCPFIVACRASVACRAGDSARRPEGVWTLDRFIGLGAGLGVNGPPYSSSSCWWTLGLAIRR